MFLASLASESRQAPGTAPGSDEPLAAARRGQPLRSDCSGSPGSLASGLPPLPQQLPVSELVCAGFRFHQPPPLRLGPACLLTPRGLRTVLSVAGPSPFPRLCPQRKTVACFSNHSSSFWVSHTSLPQPPGSGCAAMSLSGFSISAQEKRPFSEGPGEEKGATCSPDKLRAGLHGAWQTEA